MLRICGAAMERDALSRARCWCGGLFCGPGGAKLSTRFRRAFHTTKTAGSRADYSDLIAQADLFDGDQTREDWRAKLDAHRPTRAKARAS